jgi:hypothetical protein
VLPELRTSLGLALQNLKNLKQISFRPYDDDESDIRTDTQSVVDFTETFSLVLGVLEVCQLRPEIIEAIDFDPAKFEFVISACDDMAMPLECLSNLKVLQLLLGRSDSEDDGVPSSPDLTKHLIAGLNQMRSLVQLTLIFCDKRESSAFIKELQESVDLPCLTVVHFVSIECRISDLTEFLCKHPKAMKGCGLQCVTAQDVDPEKAYRDLLEKFRDTFQLNVLHFGPLLGTDGSRFDFPDIDQTIVSEEPNEDGYLVVDIDPYLLFNDDVEVQDGLSKMLSCMVRTE